MITGSPLNTINIRIVFSIFKYLEELFDFPFCVLPGILRKLVAKAYKNYKNKLFCCKAEADGPDGVLHLNGRDIHCSSFVVDNDQFLYGFVKSPYNKGHTLSKPKIFIASDKRVFFTDKKLHSSLFILWNCLRKANSEHLTLQSKVLDLLTSGKVQTSDTL
jgi:hypothetical protein